MKKYKSARNGQIAELVSENEKQVVIRLEESGEERKISPATLKRWWKPHEEELIIEEPQTEETIQDEPAEEDNVIDISNNEEPAPIDNSDFEKEQEEQQKELIKKKEKKELKKSRETISGDHPLKNFLEQLAKERETEIFIASVPGFRSLKVGGRMYMAFTFNKKGVTLWMRSKAVEELTEYKKMNHMFDARVRFAEDTPENREEITKLLDASLEFQKNHQTKKSK